MVGSGESVSYRELDERSNQGAHLFRSLGLRRGMCIAILLENSARFFEIVWAAQRAGLYYTCISTSFTVQEICYQVADSGATVLMVSAAKSSIQDTLSRQLNDLKVMVVGSQIETEMSFELARAKMPIVPIADESPGTDMLYSSGTTGKPKGIQSALPDGSIAERTRLVRLGEELYGMDLNTVFLSPAPLYHSAPLRWCMTVHRLGGTTVVMEKFDAEAALASIERFSITHAQWVPTHFVRLLKLPEETRLRYRYASLKVVFHAAAPCPMTVKQSMIDWWGPIVHEYYAGTEFNGFTAIDSIEWLKHRGSVGKAVLGKLYVCDEQGEPVPSPQQGLVYFANGGQFSYHNDEAKTVAAKNRYGWTTLGDIGWLDEGDYLYLTDRKSFMIITGGVNVYPQEVENLFVTHPQVVDVAVFGIPDEDMGEKVVAVVQPVDAALCGPGFAASLREWAAAQLSPIKMPRIIDFMNELPRHPNGKLYKKALQETYSAKFLEQKRQK